MSANEAQKNPFVRSLNIFSRDVADSVVHLLGKSVPAIVDSIDPTNTIVTVIFQIQSNYTLPPVTCPVATSRYARAPLVKGTKGYVVPGDFFLGQMSGLGTGTATLDQMSNLTNSVFVPLGNTNIDPVDDPDAYQINAPNGFIARTDDKKAVVTANGEKISLVFNSQSIVINDDGIKLTFGSHTLEINIDGLFFNGVYIGELHEHSGVMAGGSNTGPVIP